ncbi:hypothetical protein MLD52_21875 [Puniceicoccaceae bacterium K14]|nr:hypothetical protein [Puniceicoccaceae bacterium K14]
MKSSSQPLLITILLLLVANLAATVLVYQKIAINDLSSTANGEPVNPLPEEINKVVIEEIFSSFRDKYNSGDLVEFASLFSEFARSQMKDEDLEKNYAMLRDYFGDVDSGTYSHYVYNGSQGNLSGYTLHFILDLGDDSKFGSEGTGKIGITWDGTDYGIISSHIFAGGE